MTKLLRYLFPKKEVNPFLDHRWYIVTLIGNDSGGDPVKFDGKDYSELGEFRCIKDVMGQWFVYPKSLPVLFEEVR